MREERSAQTFLRQLGAPIFNISDPCYFNFFFQIIFFLLIFKVLFLIKSCFKEIKIDYKFIVTFKAKKPCLFLMT